MIRPVRRSSAPNWVDPAADSADPAADPAADLAADSAADSAGPARTGEHWAAAGAVGSSSRLQAALSHWLAIGLWGAVGLALVLGVVNVAGAPASAPNPTGGGESIPEPVAPPGGCAELVVASWLAGETGVLSGIAGLPQVEPAEGRRRAVHTWVAAVTPGSPATSWGYLVAAQVQQRDEDDRWLPPGLQFFTVTLSRSSSGCQGWSPVAPPARVAAPQLAGEVAFPYPISLATSGTDLSETLEALFAAMLAGTGSLERYVSPGVSIPVVDAPRYGQVRLAELRAGSGSPADAPTMPADGTVVQLLATVVADPENDALPLVYPVTVGVRGGRWELISLDPVVGVPAGSTAVAPRPTGVTQPDATPGPPTLTP